MGEKIMSNTGLKCISASHDDSGEVTRYQVTVQWKGTVLKGQIDGDDLDAAKVMRRKFERALAKPRTEAHIRSSQNGVFISTDSFGKESWVAQVGQERKCFSINKYGDQRAKQMAKRARKKMFEQAYLVGRKRK